ncbi:MAG: heterodisulfide reductase-related iron-sulfur binding cluster [Rhodothalassiaceae bacterium]
MREGSLEAPTRHPIAWREEAYYDADAIDAELRRVFDICHSCRRCFNLCDAFPRLFDLIDESATGELDSVDSKDFKPVVDACTLCDMCFMTKCPYVPPHEFDIDFPHLMLRYRAAELRLGARPRIDRELAKTDRNGRIGTRLAPLANWATRRDNGLTRPLIEALADIDRNAEIPPFAPAPAVIGADAEPPALNRAAPAYGQRRAVLYATCFGNYNDQRPLAAARTVLAHNGVETVVRHPACCGMPKLENGDLAGVAAAAGEVAADLLPFIDDGFDIIAVVPSCALMLKFEWPLILPDDDRIRRLATATFDVAEYVLDIKKRHGLVDGLAPLAGGISVHLACHARAQNMGAKAAEMLRLIPGTGITVVERCSGHGGKWGMMKAHFATASKVGRPAARRQKESGAAHRCSECPLAGIHLEQLVEGEAATSKRLRQPHPIELLAESYGLSF